MGITEPIGTSSSMSHPIETPTGQRAPKQAREEKKEGDPSPPESSNRQTRGHRHIGV
jgi:hypothetical protein